jgi:hypothetical protein
MDYFSLKTKMHRIFDRYYGYNPHQPNWQNAIAFMFGHSKSGYIRLLNFRNIVESSPAKDFEALRKSISLLYAKCYKESEFTSKGSDLLSDIALVLKEAYEISEEEILKFAPIIARGEAEPIKDLKMGLRYAIENRLSAHISHSAEHV